MKILIINLLRIGDTLMTVPIINGLAARRSDAQIDLLTFKPVSALKPMIPKVRRWWTLDRDELQEGMNRADIPTLTSFAVLQEQLNVINAEEYDLIINLTQTHFSAWIAGYLKCSDRLGLTYDIKGQPHFYSPWFRYLDEHADPAVKDVFHYTDIFCHACGLGESARDWSLSTTSKGLAELEALQIDKGHDVIALQLFTSDEEKTWPLNYWIDFCREIKRQKPNLQIVGLASPQERERLIEIVQACDIIPAVMSLEGARCLLDRAKVLISADTSIKHMANACRAKVIELSIGWSDWRRTGIYKEDSYILRSRSQGTISVGAVVTTCLNLLDGQTREVEASVRILKTCVLKSGFWFAQDIGTAVNAEEIVTTLVDRVAWKITLSRERQNEFAHFGSEGVNLSRELKSLSPHQEPMLAQLDFLEREEDHKIKQVGAELMKLKRELSSRADIFDIASFRRRQIELELAHIHIEHRTKLIRTLKTNWMENL